MRDCCPGIPEGPCNGMAHAAGTEVGDAAHRIDAFERRAGAVSTTRTPSRTFGSNQPRICSQSVSGSVMRPIPVSPQACDPLSGPRTITPSSRKRPTLRWVAGCSHICRFIAGATISGQSRARHSVESRSSAAPCGELCEEVGARRRDNDEVGRSRRELDVGPMPLPTRRIPEVRCARGARRGPASVAVPTKRVAASVITTSHSGVLPSRVGDSSSAAL